MALATQCPHCQTRFRVASDQLKLRGGIVRCGACQRIFDGSAHLIDLDAPKDPTSPVAETGAEPAAVPDVPVPAAVAPAPLPSPELSPEVAPEPAPESSLPGQEDVGVDFASQPVYTLDFTSTFDPLGILPKAAPAAAEPQSQDPEPPHGDVLAHAVEEAGAAAEVEVDVDLPPPDDEAPEPEAAEPQPQPQDREPPHGDVLAHAVDEAGAGGQVEVQVDVDLPPLEDEAPEPAAAAPQPQPQDPEPPHGDVLAHAVDTLTFAPQNRIEPRLAPEDDIPAAVPAEPAAPETFETPAPAAAKPPAPTPVPSQASALSFAPPGRIEPSFDLPVDEELVALPLPGDEPEPPVHAVPDSAPHAPAAADESAPLPALPLRASAGFEPQEPAMGAGAAPVPRSARPKAAEARARRTKLTPTRIETPRLRVPESDEPEFVKRSRKQEQSGRTRRILMAIGAVVLLLVLAAQLVLNFRNVLAARYPGARPALGAVCALLGCRVELPTQIDNLAIENGELTTLGPDTYSLNTLLRNQGSLVQAWPSIELELTDANDKAVLRRVFAPGEYLPHNGAAAMAASGFGPRSEQPIKLHFALADLKPSGYHIFIFYP